MSDFHQSLKKGDRVLMMDGRIESIYLIHLNLNLFTTDNRYITYRKLSEIVRKATPEEEFFYQLEKTSCKETD